MAKLAALIERGSHAAWSAQAVRHLYTHTEAAAADMAHIAQGLAFGRKALYLPSFFLPLQSDQKMKKIVRWLFLMK
jgi:hypothetical protein